VVSGFLEGALSDSRFSSLAEVIGELTPEERGALVRFLREAELMLDAGEVAEAFRSAGLRDVEVFEWGDYYVVSGVK